MLLPAWGADALAILILAAAGCLISLVVVAVLALHLHRLLLRSEEECTPDDLYRLFIRSESVARTWLTILLLIWSLAAIYLFTALEQLLFARHIMTTSSATQGFIAATALLAPLAFFELVAAATVERRALRRLRNVQVALTGALNERVRRLLWLYPAACILIFVYLGILPSTSPGRWYWFLPLASAAWFLLNLPFTGLIRRWLYPTYSIGETDWADQEERIRSWARLAGVQLKAIYIQSTEKMGKAPLDITGFRRHSLYLSDLWLNSTDWRQQDAMLCHLLGRARESGEIVCMEVYGLLMMIPAGISLYIPKDFSLGPIPIGYSSPDFPFSVPFILMVLCLIAFGVPLYYWMKRLVRHIDRFAIVLTGDPYALMVGLYTWGNLNAFAAKDSINWRWWHLAEERGTGPIYGVYGLYAYYLIGFATAFPDAETRSKAINISMRTEAPHAPWATTPVPSLTPLFLGDSYPITAPIETMPPAAPVPVGLYQRTLLFAAAPANA